METAPSGASVSVLPDAEALAMAAARLILEEAGRAVAERGRFTIALAGGSTPEPVYRLLAAPPFAESMPWAQTEVFWGDERCVAPDDRRSNERMAREALLDHVRVTADRVHPIRCGRGRAVGSGRAGGGPGRRAPARPPRPLRSARPGTTKPCSAPSSGRGAASTWCCSASATMPIPPHSSLAPRLSTSGSDGWRRLRRAPARRPRPRRRERLWRVTLTAPFINRAGMVLFVVSGASKAPAVRRVLQGEGDPHLLPALLIRPTSGRSFWLLDEAAAAR